MYKRLILTLLFCGNQLRIQAGGSVILLNGIGSSGKTSISKYLSKLLGSSCKVLSIDQDILWPFARQQAERLGLINQQIPVQQQEEIIIKHVAQILQNFIASDWLIPAQLLHNKVKDTATVAPHVIVDTALGLQSMADVHDFQEKTQEFHVFTVLVYCPPATHVQHLICRNSLPINAEKRDLLSTLPEFCFMYAPATTDYFVDTLTKQDVEKALKMVRKNLLDRKMGEIAVREKIAELKALYHTIFFQNEDEVFIAPRFIHNFMVNTAQLSSQQAAQLIYEEFMKSRS